MAVARSLITPGPDITMIVDLGARATDLAVVENGQIIFVRSIATAGESFTRAVAAGLNLDINQAEAYKRAYGADPEKLEGKMINSLIPVIEIMVAEMEKIIQFHQLEKKKNIKRIILTGGTASLPDIASFLAKKLNLEIQIGNPFVSVVKDVLVKKNPPSRVTLICNCQRFGDEGDLMRQEIDFLKGARGEREKRLKLLRMVKALSILLLLVYCLVVAAFFSYSFYLNTNVRKTTNEIALKKNKIEDLKEIETLQVVLKERLSVLLKFFDGQREVDFIVLLDYFDSRTQGVAIRDLSLSPEGKIKFSGEALDVIALGQLLDSLTSKEAEQIFSSIILSNLAKNENDASYIFTILLETRV